jgi:lysyl-tRNA synthetase class 2
MSAECAKRSDDKEQRWRPTASLRALQRRAAIKQAVRRFFYQRDVLEVDVPLLSAGANTDPAMQPLRVPLAQGDRYLHTSPEFALKRLVAAYGQDVYFLGPVFRASESGQRHNPEFHMLEWYRVGWDHHRLADEVVALLQTLLSWHERPVRRLSYQQALEQLAGVDPFAASDAVLAERAAQAGLVDASEMSRADLLDFLLGTVVADGFAKGALTVVSDFPAEQAALARLTTDTPPRAARFEVYAGALELANGYHELCDAEALQARVVAEQALVLERDGELRPLDALWLASQQHGLPDCAGVALGLDRLVMLAGDTLHIDDVLAFPFDRA